MSCVNLKQWCAYYNSKESLLPQNRAHNQNIAEYMTHLKKLPKQCCFGEILNESLCDQTVVGLKLFKTVTHRVKTHI